MSGDEPGETIEVVEQPQPTPRRKRHIGRLIVNLVAVVAATTVIVSLVNAVNASAVPMTDEEIMAAVRVTPEDVAELTVNLDEQRELLEDAGGTVREQANSLMTLKVARDELTSHACAELTQPTLPNGEVWSTRAVWLTSAPLEIALTNGAQVFSDPAEAAERFELLKDLSTECPAEVTVDMTTPVYKIPRMQVTHLLDGAKTEVVYTLLGNVIFVASVSKSGAGGAGSRVTASALGPYVAKIDRFGAEQFAAIVAADRE